MFPAIAEPVGLIVDPKICGMVEYATMRTAPNSRKIRERRGVRLRLSVGLLLAVALFSAAPAARAQAAPPQSGTATSTPQANGTGQQNTDPVSQLIALSTSHFEAGQRELRDGHLEMATAAFNLSL